MYIRGETLRKNKLFLTDYFGVYYVLLRILRNLITEIAVLYKGICLLGKNLAESGPNTLLLEKIGQNRDLFFSLPDITEYFGYYGIFYYGILRKITVRNVFPLTCFFYMYIIYVYRDTHIFFYMNLCVYV